MSTFQRIIFICFFCFSIFSSKKCTAQFSCPDSLIYTVDVQSVGNPNYSINVYNPKLPISANNPGITSIPKPIGFPGTYVPGLALLPNLNGGQPSPTLYSTLRVSTYGFNYCYWNGSVWVDTGTPVPQSSAYAHHSIGGCNNAIYSMSLMPNPLGGPSIGNAICANYSNGTSLGPAVKLFTVGTNAFQDIVTDCSCNIYILFTDCLKKFSANGALLQTYMAINPFGGAGKAFAIVGNTIYATGLGDAMSTAVITGNTYSFTSSTSTISFGPDFASCPVTTIISTAASINSGSIGCNPGSLNLVTNTTLSPLSYHWSGPGIGSSVPGSSVMNVNSAGLFTCSVTQPNCDYVLASVVSTVISNVTQVNPQILQGNLLCLSPFMQLTATVSPGPYSFKWNGPAITSANNTPSISLNGTGVYSLVVTDNTNGCTGVVSSSILPVPLLSLGISTPTLCVYSTDGKDKAILTYSTSTNTYTLLVSPGFSISLQPSQPIVLIQLAPFQPNGSAGTATIIGSNGVCTGSAITGFSVLAVAKLSASALTPTVCKGATTQLQASGALTYTWFPKEKYLSTTNENALTNVISGITEFSVIGTDQYACNTAPESVIVKIHPDWDGYFTVPKICAGDCATIRFSPFTPTNNTIYSSWTLDGKAYLGDKNTICFQNDGLFEFKGILQDSLYGCKNSIAYTFTVHPSPIAKFTITPEHPVELIDLVNFTNQSTGINQNIKYQWHLSDNNITETNTNFSHLFENPGNYVVVLLAKNEYGCEDTAISAIRVEEDFLFYVPNCFTPNADNLNDVFVPMMRGVKLYDLSIFDRWGKQIFYTKEQQQGWDGYYNSEICKMDIYIWKAIISTKHGENKIYTGEVLLNR